MEDISNNESAGGIDVDNSVLSNHIKRVNKAFCIILCFVALVAAAMAISVDHSIDLSIAVLVLSAIISVTLLVKKKNDMTIAKIICYGYLTNNILGFYLYGNDINYLLYGLIINCCLAMAYLNKRFFGIYVVILNLALIIPGLFFKDKFGAELISTIAFVDVCLIMLYFINKWGSELIISSEEKEKKIEKALGLTQDIMYAIGDNSTSLHQSIEACEDHLSHINHGSEQLVATMQETTNSIVEQTSSINMISSMITDADQHMSETVSITQKMLSVSDKTSEVVKEGARNIDEMDKQMKILNRAVTQSLSTVSELEKSMEEINQFLEGITGIAKQTNLLALNAAIEAARAGEQGRGFAIVADEIRKLAEQSSETVNLINNIIGSIKQKTTEVFLDVKEGTLAVQEGEQIVNKVTHSFTDIKSSFKEIDGCIEEELKIVNDTSAMFKTISDESQSISAISEEHSASVEEMLATLTNQSEEIGNIFTLIKEIGVASGNLENTAIKAKEANKIDAASK